MTRANIRTNAQTFSGVFAPNNAATLRFGLMLGESPRGIGPLAGTLLSQLGSAVPLAS